MFPLPFFIGAILGAGTVFYLKKDKKGKALTSQFSQGIKSGTKTLNDAATTTVDTIKSTVETIQEKNKEKKESRASNKGEKNV
jgi:hypothetical protein